MAVQLGAAWVRVAVDDPRPRLLAALPVGAAGPTHVLWAALVALLDRPVDELVVVQAPGAPPSVPPWAARVVRGVPAAVAALGGRDGVVVDVGHSGSGIARVERGRVVAVRRVAVGGAVLDEATADLLGEPVTGRAGLGGAERGRAAEPAAAGCRSGVRAAREALSLQPVRQVGAPPVELSAAALRRALAPHLAPVVDAVRAVGEGAGPERSPPVLLVGGVARMPLLAELLDAAGVDEVRVADRPDVAAVIGALRLPPALLGPPLLGAPPPGRPSPAVTQGAAASSGAPSAEWLPPVAPRRLRPLRTVAVAAASAAALVGLYAAGAALPTPAPVPLAATGELVQYGYAARLPAGWAHTGGLPERRRSLLTPVGAPDGGNLISVERTPLGYDADAEPQRARAELRAEFDRSVTGGAPLSGFDEQVDLGGRRVVGYREAAGPHGHGDAGRAADAARVDWYVVLDADSQLSVGCRYTAAEASTVAAACATVVGSVRRTA